MRSLARPTSGQLSRPSVGLARAATMTAGTPPVARGGQTGAGGSEGEIARQKAESKLFGLSGVQSDRIRQEMARYATMRDPRLR